MNASRNYVFFVLVLCGTLIVLTLSLNMLLAINNLRFNKNILASDWQHQTHGVTYPPPITYNRPFKTLRLNDCIGRINTVIFGSSTTMGLTENAFPSFMKPYNFAQNGNSLLVVLGEAEYIADHWGKSIKYLLIPLDWSVGFLYDPGEPATADLSSMAVTNVGNSISMTTVASRIKDALSLPQVKNLLSILAEVLRSEHRLKAFRQYFFEPSSDDYRCSDGELARDFDTYSRGLCIGFRYDGSATFAGQKPVQPGEQQSLVTAAVVASSKYSQALRLTKGNPNSAVLDQLAVLSHHVVNSGGKVIFFFPPLLPGLERQLEKQQDSGRFLARTKLTLGEWARSEGLVLLDAGASERFDCKTTEFIDPHHALPDCYNKIFGRFWKDYFSASGIKPGLYAG